MKQAGEHDREKVERRGRRPGRSGAQVPLLLAILLAGGGCSSIGPPTVQRDRFDYGRSISESWKCQTLLNIVKLRYLDPPFQVDVGQIVAGYSLEADVSLGGTLDHEGDSLSLGAAGRYTDRPTITYTPLTGNRFLRSSVMPLPPSSVFFTIQAGWPADGVLSFAVASINGLKNQEASVGGVTPPDPDFLRVLDLLRKIQLSGAVALRILVDGQKQQTTLLTFRTREISPELAANIAEVRRLLRLDPEAQDLKLVFAVTPANSQEVAVVTRSLLQIMATMATYVEVPSKDIAEGRATPGLNTPTPVRIRCAGKRPTDAFAAVAYRGRWFWVDDRDLKTKRALGLLLLLHTLADTGEREPLPLITIPTQ